MQLNLKFDKFSAECIFSLLRAGVWPGQGRVPDDPLGIHHPLLDVADLQVGLVREEVACVHPGAQFLAELRITDVAQGKQVSVDIQSILLEAP